MDMWMRLTGLLAFLKTLCVNPLPLRRLKHGERMLIDIVVDTNVLAHAQSPNETRFSDAVIFFESATKVCSGGRFAFGSGNSSLIGQEYISTVGFGGVAYAVLQSLLQANRIK